MQKGVGVGVGNLKVVNFRKRLTLVFLSFFFPQAFVDAV